MLSRMGVEALPSEVMASKNVALVSISATLPKFGRMGDWLKVDVAAVGNAKSLEGGRLVLSPLLAPMPGQQGLVTYAVAQGALKTDPNNPTTACIENGAIIQREVPAQLTPGNRITFKLLDGYTDCEVATLIVKVIHEDLNVDTTSAKMGGAGDLPVARAVDPATVEVTLTPQQAADPVPFISHLERLPVAGLSSAMEARVVIDEKNGAFYAINGNVEISPVVVGYRNLQPRDKGRPRRGDDARRPGQRAQAPRGVDAGRYRAAEGAGIRRRPAREGDKKMNPIQTTPGTARVMPRAAPSAPSMLGPARGTRDAAVVAGELAGLFYSMMISAMQKAVPENPYFTGRGEGTFRKMWINETGRQLACRRGDPLAGAILEEVRTGARGGVAGDRQSLMRLRAASGEGEQG